MFKKLLSLTLASAMVMGMGISAFAAEPAVSSTNETKNAPKGMMGSARTVPTKPAMEVGETRIIGYIGDEPLKITLVSESDNQQARGQNKTASQLYRITYFTKTIISVTLVASYYHDGINSEMRNLKGTYKILDSTVSASWDTSSNTSTTTYHGMTLVVNSLAGVSEIRFEAWIIPNDVGGVDFYMD